MKQKTLKSEISISGIGLHSGESCKVTIKPAEPNSGLQFLRVDMPDSKAFKADIKTVSDTTRSTTISNGTSSVQTVEHLLATFYGLGITNALIEVDGVEIPILDGSAREFVDAILSVGLADQDKDANQFIVEKEMHFVSEDGEAEYTMLPSSPLEIICFSDFDSKYHPPQYAEYNSSVDFIEDLAPARTFVFAEDLIELKNEGIIKGGSLDNALVLYRETTDHANLNTLSKMFDVNIDQVSGNGIVNADEYRFNNEIARHKLLDFLGDLALLGTRIQGKIIIKKPGHRSNIAFLSELKKKVQEQKKLKGRPIYDPNQTPVHDIIGITNLLPHRFPFLLVDKIVELSDDRVVGVKNVTMNENFFQGHFPGNPVFPGVLQMEALAQTGGILVLNTVEDPQNWDTYFLKMDHVKFKQIVRPGDTLILKMELLSPVRRGLVHMQGTAYVGDKIVSEGELTAQIIKRDK